MSLAKLKADLESRQVFKAWEIEENLDRYFCRPLAVLMTAAFHPLGITPNQVSIAGMLVGMSAAWFLFSDSLPRLVLAVLLLWIAEVMDAADGQLARLATRPSRYGRIIDGLCGMLLYLVLYIVIAEGLCARYGTPFYGWFAVVAAYLHSVQSSLYDYYRGEYIRISKKREATDPDAPESLARARQSQPGGGSLLKRLVLALYQHYAWRQTVTTPTYRPLARAIAERFGSSPVPQGFASRYAEEQRGMIRWWNYLGNNLHLITLSIAILARRPEWYLWAVAVGFTAYAGVITAVQAGTTRTLLAELAQGDWEEAPAPPADPPLARAQ